MIDFLLGVPGKLKTISDYLTTHLASARAAKIDNLDAAISTRAAASTALTNATWSDARAAKLDGAAQAADPLLGVPIAANFGTTEYSTSSTAYVTAVSITGKGVLKGVLQKNGTASTFAYLKVTIDGVVVRDTISGSTASAIYQIPIGAGYTTLDGFSGFDFIPFKSSLLIEHKLSGPASTLYTKIALHRTA